MHSFLPSVSLNATTDAIADAETQIKLDSFHTMNSIDHCLHFIGRFIRLCCICWLCQDSFEVLTLSFLGSRESLRTKVVFEQVVLIKDCNYWANDSTEYDIQAISKSANITKGKPEVVPDPFFFKSICVNH